MSFVRDDRHLVMLLSWEGETPAEPKTPEVSYLLFPGPSQTTATRLCVKPKGISLAMTEHDTRGVQ